MYYPDEAGFMHASSSWRTIPVVREIQADEITPVSAFKALAGDDGGFLLESVEGGEKWARYSFVGATPEAKITVHGQKIEVAWRSGSVEAREEADPLRSLVAFGLAQNTMPVEQLPRFAGGLVGAFSYDMVRHVEHLPNSPEDDLGLPDACFFLTDLLVVFDSKRQSAFVISHVKPENHPSVQKAYAHACAVIEGAIKQLEKAPRSIHLKDRPPDREEIASVTQTTLSQEAYRERVENALEYVRSGDIIQVVLSRRFSRPADGIEPFEVYRMLRAMNPSPYLFYFNFGTFSLAGSSPEVLVRFDGKVAEVRPIAGTRKRGNGREEDNALAKDLQEDPKEIAEHIMLLDLGRNDIGRISRPGTVEVTDQMLIEYYSHVMHMVSSVRGMTREEIGPAEVIRATFPAGTLSGAPKVRAMEIIDELEPVRRGLYGGAVGYIDFSGNMDLCIAIRCLVASKDMFHVQAGAGIVYDSDPQKETEETEMKARAILRAIQMAKQTAGGGNS